MREVMNVKEYLFELESLSLRGGDLLYGYADAELPPDIYNEIKNLDEHIDRTIKVLKGLIK